MKKNLKIFTLTSSLVLAAGIAKAQTPTTWTGAAGDGLWNTAGNWDAGVPAEGYDAIIPAGVPAVSYASPMLAPSFGSLLSSNTLTVASTGFNLTSGITFSSAGGLFRMNSGAIVSGATFVSMQMGSSLAISPGATLDTPSATLSLGGSGTGNIGFLTNSGGNITVSGLRVNPNNASSSARAVISGGVNNLGNVTVQRSSSTGSFATTGSEGLYITDGQVTMTSLDVGGNGGNSYLSTIIAGGTVTNTGATTVRQITGSRGSRFLQTGGVYSGSGVVTIHPQPTSAGVLANSIMIYSVTGGTNLIGGLALGLETSTMGTIRITNAAKMYIGSGGITAAGVVSAKTIALNAGSVLGAQADWTGTEPMLLNGGIIECADLSGTPHNITISGELSGSATAPLVKTGSGILTLDGANTYVGETLISQGTLAIGPSGTLASGLITIPAGNTLDISQAYSFSLSSGRTVGGFGSILGTLNVGTAGIINPGTNDLGGVLTVNGGLSLNGGGVAHFDLTSNPASSSNDKLVVNGDFTLNGNNSLEVLGSPSQGNTYTLIQYTGVFIGDISSLTVAGAAGTLIHDAATKRITLTVSEVGREPTELAWLGNDVENVWDALTHTNWLNLTTSKLDNFMSGDDVIFNVLGATHPTIDIIGTVLPGSVTFDSTSDYTLQGAGSIGGPTGLTKTNTGKLTITAANSYTGPTLIKGGKVSVAQIAAPATASPLGAASGAAASLVLDGGTLEYTGPSLSMNRGMQLGANGGGLEIADASATVQTYAPFEGTGILVKSGPGTLDVRVVNNYSGGTEITAGTVRVDKDSNATLGTGKIALKGTETTPATLRFGGDGHTISNPVEFIGTNNFLQNSGNDTLSGTLSGNGTVLLLGSSGNVLTLAGDMTAFGGSIILESVTNLRFMPSLGSAAALFDLGQGTGLANNRNGNLTISLGSLLGGPGTRLQGGSNDDGNGRDTTYRIGGRNADALFDGVISETSPLRKLHIVKEGTGKWTLSNTHTYTGNTTVSNGVLVLTGAGSFDSSANVAIVAPGQVDVSARYDLNLSIGNGLVAQTITGNGSILGGLSVGNNGTVSPGFPTGTLTVSQAATIIGKAVIGLNRASTPNSGRLVATSISLNAELTVTNTGAALQVGDTFDLLDGTIDGSFSAITLPAGYTWNTDNLYVDGTIRVATVLAPPQIGGITIIGTDAVLTASGGTPGGAVSVLSSGDLSLPVAQWTVAGTGNFDANGNISLSIPVDGANPQRFYTLQIN